MGNNGNSERLYLGGWLQNHCRWWLQPRNKKMLAPWKKSYDQLRQHIKKQRHYFANNGLSSQSYDFSSSHVWMWELDYKAECWSTDAFELLDKTLESPLDCKEIQQVHPKGYHSWIFIGKTDAEAETPIHWPPDVKSWLIRKDPDAGKDRRQERKGTTEDEMVGWHHWLNRQEFKPAPGDGEGQGSLAWCSPWDSPGKNTAVGCHFFLQRIVPTQGMNPNTGLWVSFVNWIDRTVYISHSIPFLAECNK